MRLNVKYLCLGTCLCVSSLNFSFYKLDEMYCNIFSNNEIKTVRFSDMKEEDKENVFDLFLYDKNTCMQLHITNRDLKPMNVDKDLDLLWPNVFKLLNCDFNYDLNFCNEIHKLLTNNIICFYYKKQPVIFREDGSIQEICLNLYLVYCNKLEKMLNKTLDDNKKILAQEWVDSDFCLWKILNSFKKQPIQFMNTPNGIKLNIYDHSYNFLKEVDITEALQHYFVKDICDLEIDKFVEQLAKSSNVYPSPVISEKQLAPALNLRNYNRKALKKEDYNRLKSSTILAVGALIPDGLIGLARDNRTKELYYWATDLGQDISVFINYESRKLK